MGRSSNAPRDSVFPASVSCGWDLLPGLQPIVWTCSPSLYKSYKTPAGSAPAAQGLKLPVFPDKPRPVWSPVALYNMSPHLLPNAASSSLFSYLAVPSLHARRRPGAASPAQVPLTLCHSSSLCSQSLNLVGQGGQVLEGFIPLDGNATMDPPGSSSLIGQAEDIKRFLKVGGAPTDVHHPLSS